MVLEKHSRAHVLSRIRAGVLEQSTVDVLRENCLSERMDREGQPHDGVKIVWAGRSGFFIDVARHVGRRFMTYGQTSIQEDLFAAADRRSARYAHRSRGCAADGCDLGSPARHVHPKAARP